MSEWDFYQIDKKGVQEPDIATSARTDPFTTIRRRVDMKISNFGALALGYHMTDDYTRTDLTFFQKDTSADIAVLTEDGGAGGRTGQRSVVVDNNPYLWGSTVKKVRDDQFFRMNMDNNVTGAGIDKPKFDVSDTNVVNSGMVQYKNYPTEGWRSFGGKYDKLAWSVDGTGKPLTYDGVLR